MTVNGLVGAIARRDEFAGAALRVIARSGLGALTVRAVAEEAGWSVGALQKTFGSVDDLVRAAVALTIRTADARIAATPLTGDLVVDVATMVERTLPLDQLRRDEAKVWAALTTRAVDVPWMAELFVAQDRLVTDQLAAGLAQAADLGLLPADTDVAAVAAAVVALSDGFAARLLYNPDSRAEVLGALRYALAALLPRAEQRRSADSSADRP